MTGHRTLPIWHTAPPGHVHCQTGHLWDRAPTAKLPPTRSDAPFWRRWFSYSIQPYRSLPALRPGLETDESPRELEVDAAAAPYNWKGYLAHFGGDPEHASALRATGQQRAADPRREWWVSFEPVSASQWIAVERALPRGGRVPIESAALVA